MSLGLVNQYSWGFTHPNWCLAWIVATSTAIVIAASLSIAGIDETLQKLGYRSHLPTGPNCISPSTVIVDVPQKPDGGGLHVALSFQTIPGGFNFRTNPYLLEERPYPAEALCSSPWKMQWMARGATPRSLRNLLHDTLRETASFC